jgi:hypothetical protein
MVMPCCGASSSLNDLVCEWSAGLASCRLWARKPVVRLAADAELEEIAAALGSPLRQVYAQY